MEKRRNASPSQLEIANQAKITNWLNEATLATDPDVKTDNLNKVQEILVEQTPEMIATVLDSVIAFQFDRNFSVRRCVVNFFEKLCKKYPSTLPAIAGSLQLLLNDKAPQVQKRVIQASSQIYKEALIYICNTQNLSPKIEQAWTTLCGIKSHIVTLIDNDNDGIRTHSVKFLESIVLLQTYPEADSLRRESDFNLEDIPLTLKIVRRRRLEEEANMIFELLVKFHGSPHVSSVNLMTCMGSLTLIARLRSQFMGKVVACMDSLHKNFPPTLSKSQVSAVKKHMKLQLLSMLKLPSSIDYQADLTKLLLEIGATPQEVAKATPKVDGRASRTQKRPSVDNVSSLHKRPKLEAIYKAETTYKSEPIYKTEAVNESVKTISEKKSSEPSGDISEKYIIEKLNADVVAKLVLASVLQLPDTMPSTFPSLYSPITGAGSPSHIKHLAKILYSQISGTGKKLMKKSGKVLTELEEEDEDMDEDSCGPPSGVNPPPPPYIMNPPNPSTVNVKVEPAENSHPLKDSAAELVAEREKLKELTPMTPITRPLKQKAKALKLAEITKPLGPELRSQMCMTALHRVLNAETPALIGGVNENRNKIITTLACNYGPEIRNGILKFVVEDLQRTMDLAISWLYEEYAVMQKFTTRSMLVKDDISSEEKYNHVLCTLAAHLAEKSEREPLLTKLYLEAPLITEQATEMLKELSCDETRCAVGLQLLMNLVIRKPPKQLTYLNALLHQTAHDSVEVRSHGMQCVLSLYNDRADLRSIIEEYAVLYLGFLRLPTPPEVLFGAERGRPVKGDAWVEPSIRACLYLYLELLPHEHKLIHELTRVYVLTIQEVKRHILRLLDVPVKGMGMDSPELLKLVEDCPKGAETLVTRVLHILTDKTPPSSELVARVRDLYHQSRVSDVRFLIPVLNGLTKREVIDSLPKLIKLNPIVVKEVFNRLLCTHSDSGHNSPITPAELLVALHVIDLTKCELKTVIKATNLCFSEKQAYTQEVLAVVMQQLMEISPLPTLLMRTVIQSLAAYPNLSGFVMNILQRLIIKQVWTQPKVWEGFVKCCQRTTPQSFQVLLQLPAVQLQEVLVSCPEIKEPLLHHVLSFSDVQRSHVQKSVMDVLTGTKREPQDDYDSSTADPSSPQGLTIDVKDEPSEGSSQPLPPGMD